MTESGTTLKTTIFTRLPRPGYWLAIFLLVYNNLVNLIPPSIHSKIYIWMNLGVLFLIWLWSRQRLNLTHIDLGYTRQNLGKSMLFGLGLTASIIIPFLGLLLILPVLNIGIKAPSLGQISAQTIWGRVFFRIPLGTVFFEEMLFRSIFYGYLIRKVSGVKTVFITSFFFALWHITPAFKVISTNFQMAFTGLGIVLWIIGLLGAFIGGILFAWIRYRTRNIAGCILAHLLINTLALVIIYWVWR